MNEQNSTLKWCDNPECEKYRKTFPNETIVCDRCETVLVEVTPFEAPQPTE